MSDDDPHIEVVHIDRGKKGRDEYIITKVYGPSHDPIHSEELRLGYEPDLRELHRVIDDYVTRELNKRDTNE